MPKSKQIRFFLLGGGLFLFFILFSYLVAREVFVHFDFDTTVRLQDRIPRRFDDLFSLLSDLGKFEVMLIVLFLIIGFTRKLWGIVAFGLFGFIHVIELYGKYLVDQLPPPEFMIRTTRIIEFPQFHVRSDFSYPSGHAARAAFLTILIGYLILSSKRLSQIQKYLLLGVLVAYDFLLFISRPYLGEHWASDVFGGILLGSSFALLSLAFTKIRIFGKKNQAKSK